MGSLMSPNSDQNGETVAKLYRFYTMLLFKIQGFPHRKPGVPWCPHVQRGVHVASIDCSTFPFGFDPVKKSVMSCLKMI